jgi:hypothetical protein
MGKQVGVEETKRASVIGLFRQNVSLKIISQALEIDMEKVREILKYID